MSRKNLLGTGLLIIILIIIGKVVAFGKDIAVSAYFGASSNTDAYFIAINITTMLFVAFYSTVNIVFLPMYNNQKVNFGRKVADKFSRNMISIYVLVSVLISFIGFHFSSEIINMISDKNYASRNELSINLLKIMVLSFPFSVLVSFLTSIELNNKQYSLLHLVPIINNLLIVVALIFFASIYGVYIAAIAGVFAWVIQVPLHLYFVRYHFKYSFHLNIFDQKIKKIWVLFIPAFFGVLVDNSNVMVDTILASKLEDGSISALNYSSRLISFASGIFIMAIMSISFPIFSKLIEKNEILDLSIAIKNSFRALMIIMSFIMIVVFIFHKEIVSIIYQRGEFDLADTVKTSEVFFYYGLGLIFIALRELFNKIFYAFKNTKIPLVISVCSVTTNIILSLYLVKSMGVNGLALASSLSLMLYVFLQLLFLSKFIDIKSYTDIPIFLVKILLSLLVSVFAIWIVKGSIAIKNYFLMLLVPSMTGFLVYFVMLQLFNIGEVKLVTEKIHSVYNKVRASK